MNNFAYIIIIVLCITIIEACAQSCIKKYHNSSNFFFFILAILFYTFICYLLTITYKYEDMGIANVLWSGLSIIVILITGVIAFKEIIHYHDIFAIFLILSGILIFRFTN